MDKRLPSAPFSAGILMGTSDSKIDPWSFLTPFTFELWYTIIGTSFVVAIMICVIDKLSPYGYHGESQWV